MRDRWYQTESVESIGPFYAGDMQGNHPLIGLPTGTGKSLVIARLIQMIMNHYPWHRVMALTHVKKLIEQNSKRLLNEWPNAPVGICSAGLKQRDVAQPIIFGGIQTIVGKHELFGHRDAVIIDEAHLVSDKETTSYVKFINGLKSINPKLIVIGLSATLYRMKMGSLLDGGLFTHVAYDLTNLDGFNRLLNEGFISPLVPQPTDFTFDLSGVKKVAGEYSSSEAEKAVDTDYIVHTCCKEMIVKASDRHCGMIFAQGIEHAEHIAQELISLGENAAAVHSKKKSSDQLIESFKHGEFKWLINFGQLTTGFDHPPIDYIGMMRATLSPGLWVQMLGRGTRPYDGRFIDQYIPGFEYIKLNCLVSDFAGNTMRLGPINDPVLPRPPGKGGGDAPVKLCEAPMPTGGKCRTYNHAAARWCSLCGNEFPMGGAVLMTQSSNEQLIKGGNETPIIEFVDVSYVLYSQIDKNGAPPMMKVVYMCGGKPFSEIVCLEHKTYARKHAESWWLKKYGTIPDSTSQGLQIAKSGALQTPKRVRVWANKKPYPEVMNYEY